MRRSPLAPLIVAVAGIALATGVVFGLREIAPVLSLGVVYLLVVLVVATLWGFRAGVAAAVVSAVAYNFFHIPPTGRFTISSSENLVGLLAFLAVATAVSMVAELARARAIEATHRREEADLSATAARALLGGARLQDGLAQTAHQIALALALPSAQLVLGAPPTAPDRASSYPVGDGACTLVLPAPLAPAVDARVRERIVPALETILTSAIERDRLLDEVVETTALRRSDDLKTAILRAVSHDLRSPLTAMVTSGEALGSPALDDEDRAALSGAIVAEGARLERLIGKLLDLSRLEAGEAEPRVDSIDVAEVLTAARDELAPAAPAHLITLQLDRDLPPLRADAVQLERAFANLMENALAHGGGQPVSVRARAVGPRMVVRVVDRGPGIPQGEQARIFTPFYRGDDASPTATGSGLGLAIVRGFVEANGGTVRVESLPGQGASFVVEFPLP
ncbi:Sensor protein KdpD [Baekduia alba]|uniref:sensor histidine kinase n=1 Tax=Baekduia alba TaxID=2997333 RepID=UPI0023407359|nr:ATP-binding protein [Baekduia alba]WCB96890.1 Sensor protein KdpD [Baekduia alba]